MFASTPGAATRPDDMESVPATRCSMRRTEGPSGISLSVPGPALWAAWGNIIEKRGYLMDCMRDFAADASAAGAEWFTAGPLLKSGHPHHPLYLKGDTKLLAFDIDRYLRARAT